MSWCVCGRRELKKPTSTESTLTPNHPSLPPLRIERVPLADWQTALGRMEAGGAKKQVLEL